MAIVPPGNKQIGTQFITVVADEGTKSSLLSAAGYALVEDSGVAITPEPPRNAQIGQCNLTGVTDEGNSGSLLAAAGYAVVKYLPPATSTLLGASSYAVVKDASVGDVPLSPTLNVGLGALTITQLTDEKTKASLLAAVGYAVVKRYNPRYELLIHSLYYGKNNPFLR